MRGEGRRRAVAENEDELEGNAERAKNAAVVEWMRFGGAKGDEMDV
jgi:hypothetical protein